jgi:hypothetical protein
VAVLVAADRVAGRNPAGSIKVPRQAYVLSRGVLSL